MKWMIVLVAFSGMAIGQTPKQNAPKSSDGTVLTQASLTIAKRVCAAHGDAAVWVFHSGNWNTFACSQLGEVFALDAAENPFDQMIPLMQDLRDSQPKQAKK